MFPKWLALTLVLLSVLTSDGQSKQRFIYPESKIANISLYAFLPDGRSYYCVVYLSGSISWHHFPEGSIADGHTTDKNFFVLASAAFESQSANEIALPDLKQLNDALVSEKTSKFSNTIVIVLGPMKDNGNAKAYQRKTNEQFTNKDLRQLDQLLMEGLTTTRLHLQETVHPEPA